MNLRADPSALLPRDSTDTRESPAEIELKTVAPSYRSNGLSYCLLASVVFWTVAWHWDTATSMGSIWWRSETFAHGMIVYPVSIWLIWRARDQLMRRRPVPAYWVMLLVAGSSFAWLLGEIGGVQAARHFGLVVMLPLVVWVMVGTQVARIIAFPLAFTLLAVPIGEFLLPILMEHTADFTVGALRLSGVPVYREGNNFIIPTGSWSVVEACSGLRYLIASITLGLLYAYISYRSLPRRLLFVLASILVPIVANWVRAYLIVMIGHLSGMKYAVGVDHLIYGWIFFGLVMLLLFWVGSFWREDQPGTPEIKGNTNSGAPMSAPTLHRSLIAAISTAALVTIAPSYANYVDLAADSPRGSIALPRQVNGWNLAAGEAAAFRPHYVGARSTYEATYTSGTRRVGVYIAYFAREHEGAELVSSDNGLTNPAERGWNQLARRTVARSDVPSMVTQAQLRHPNDREVTVWYWYWTGDDWKLDPRWVKIEQAFNKLLGRGDDAAVVVLYTRFDGSQVVAAKVLNDFATEMTPHIAEALAGARVGRGASAAH